MLKYEMRVTEIGPLVSEFIACNILVFFKEGVPPELAELSILHEAGPLQADIVPDDQVIVGDQTYRVTAVGEVANKNIRNLGHMILKCNGRSEPELPGDLCVEEKSLPHIEVGTIIRVVGP